MFSPQIGFQLQPDIHGYFYSPKSDYQCDYKANIWFPDEQRALSDSVRYIYNSNTAQNPGYYSYWHWIHNAAMLLLLNCLLFCPELLNCKYLMSILHHHLHCWLERDVYADEQSFPGCLKQSNLNSAVRHYNIYQIPNQIFEEFSITFFLVKPMIHLWGKNCRRILWIILRNGLESVWFSQSHTACRD